MTSRFKLVTALLGLAVVAAAVTDASAHVVVKKVSAHGTGKAIHATKTKVIVHTPRRHAGARIVRQTRPVDGLRVVHRVPVHAKLVKFVAARAVVRVIKRPFLQRQAHRVVVRKTIIR